MKILVQRPKDSFFVVKGIEFVVVAVSNVRYLMFWVAVMSPYRLPNGCGAFVSVPVLSSYCRFYIHISDVT